MRTIGPLALLLLLAGTLATRVAAQEVTELQPTGVAHPVTLSTDHPVRVFAVTVPKGARRLHVAVVAPFDVDLHLHDGVLEPDALDEARCTAASVSMVEHLFVEGSTGHGFPEARTLYAYVENPNPEARGYAASVTAWVERDVPVLVAGEALDVSIPAGAKTAAASLLLPRGLAAARVRAQTRRGVPALSGALAGVEVPAVRGPRGAHLSLTGRPEVPAGAWRLEVSRPDGVPVEDACAVRLEASLVPRLPEDDALTDDDPVPLRGRRGEKALKMEESAWTDLLLEVPPGVRSVRIEATLEGGDVDLYATRSRPVDLQGHGNWHYASWLDGSREVLFLGGTHAVAPGLYWLAVSHVDGEGGEVRLRWEGREQPLGADEQPGSKGSLGSPVRDVRLGANEAVVWWDLPSAMRSGVGATVRALGADKDVDLLLVRSDTGAAVLRGITPVHAETLRIPRDLVLPEDVALRVGLCRWNVTDPVAGGQLTVVRGDAPPPPASYFPPYGTFPSDARGLTLSSAVHLETDDSYGSGIVVAPTGLVLTCAHLVEDVAEGEAIYISFPTRPRGRPRQLYLARVVESDETLDLALLALTRDVFGEIVPPTRRHPFVPIGDSTALVLEAPLRTVGYGSAGSSSFGSNLGVLRGNLVGVEMEGEREVWLLSDARLGPGNSGAGTFDAGGRLVGIHWGAYGETGQTLCYARPVSAIPESWRAYIRAAGGAVPKR